MNARLSALSGRTWSDRTFATVWILVVAAELVMTLRFLREEFVDLLGPSGWFAGDGERTLHATRVWLDGGQPYDVFGYLYTPLALVLSAPAAVLGDDVSIKLWLGLGVAVMVACTLVATRGGAMWARVLAVAGVLLFHATVGDYLLANTTMILVGAMFAVLRWDRAPAGIPLGILVALFPKPLLVPFLLWALIWRPRASFGVLAGAAVSTILGVLVAGPGLYMTFVETLVKGGGITVRFAGNYGLSLVSPTLAAVVAAFVLIALVYVLLRRGETVGLVWAVAGGVLVSPYAPMYSGLPLVLALPAVYRIAPGLAVAFALIVVAAEQATPLSSVVLLLAALLLPYRFDRRGRPPIMSYLPGERSVRAERSTAT